jgi:hypothetical protein
MNCAVKTINNYLRGWAADELPPLARIQNFWAQEPTISNFTLEVVSDFGTPFAIGGPMGNSGG